MMGAHIKLRQAFALVIVGLSILFAFDGMAMASFLPLTGPIVDQANILSAPVKFRITSELEDFEGEDKGPQLVLVTVNSLHGRSIEEYALDLGRHWKIGHAGKNNGIILLIAPNEREVRIEVGYGLEHILTDATTNKIIRNALVPELRKNHWDAAAEAGVKAIIKEVNSPQHLSVSEASNSDKSKSFDWWTLAFFLLIFFFYYVRYFFTLCINLIIVGIFIIPLNAVLSLFGLKPIAFKGLSLPSRSGRKGGFWSNFGGGGGGFGGGGGSFGGGGSSGRF
ncbi:MAG: TPM domain-containing protein [Alphaproteobacteria bacterium]|nr:TPM domain-containing protein [Alphaproteobacteria bacterium]